MLFKNAALLGLDMATFCVAAMLRCGATMPLHGCSSKTAALRLANALHHCHAVLLHVLVYVTRISYIQIAL